MIYIQLFFNFFLIGLFTFGGGYAMIPLIHDTITKYNWLTESEFIDLIGVCESTPGPIAINMATYIGSTQGGFFGSVLAVIGVVLPSFIIILLVATLLKKLIDNRFFKNAMEGIKPIVLSLIFTTGVSLLLKVIGYNSTQSFDLKYESLIILGILIVIDLGVKYIFKKKLSAIQMILISAVVGLNVCLLVGI